MSVSLPVGTVQERDFICSELQQQTHLKIRELTLIVTEYYFSEHHINYQRHIPQRIITILTSSLGPVSGWPAPSLFPGHLRPCSKGITLYYTTDTPSREEPITVQVITPTPQSEGERTWTVVSEFRNRASDSFVPNLKEALKYLAFFPSKSEESSSKKRKHDSISNG